MPRATITMAINQIRNITMCEEEPLVLKHLAGTLTGEEAPRLQETIGHLEGFIEINPPAAEPDIGTF